MSSIQITPLPNNLLLSSSVTTIGNNSISTLDSYGNIITNYTPNGTYKVASSSVMGSLTNSVNMPYNIFNKTTTGNYWQSDVSGGVNKNGGDSSTKLLYSYPGYTQNAYLSTSSKTATSNLTAPYQGGGSTDNTWTTIVSSKNISLPGEWVQIQLPYQVYLTKYQLITPPSIMIGKTKITATFPTKFTVVGSNNGETWDYVNQQNLSTANTIPNDNTYTITSSNKYSYFRLIISEMQYSMSNVAISGWYLSGTTFLSTTKSGFMTLSRAMEVSDIDYGNMNTNKFINSLLPYNVFEGFDTHGYIAPPQGTIDTPVFDYVPGLSFTIYKNYHNEKTDFANGAVIDLSFNTKNVTVTNINDIQSGTNNLITLNQNRSNFSIQWTGFFYTGNNSRGYWTFNTSSDDGSYLWVNDTLIVSNGGMHSLTKKTGTILLESTTYYPIKLLYGNGSGGYNITLSFTPPGSKTNITDGTGYFFSLPVNNPLPSLQPIVNKIQNNQIIPLQQISSDYSKTFNNMLQGSVDLSGNIAKITNLQGTGLRDQLMADPQYDFKGSLFNFGKDVSVGDIRVQDTKSLAEQQNSIYILGCIASVTLLITAIFVAME
jgi:hypothetical protein